MPAVPVVDTIVKKDHIVLKKDIPSAMDLPNDCLFQTRCRWEKDVLADLWEQEIPPQRDISIVHQINCHLSESKLSGMSPIIRRAAE